MSAAMENRPTANRAANVQVAEASNCAKFTPGRSRITLTPTAERWISEWACALVSGEVEFWQLPDSLREFFTYAYEGGRQSARCDSCDRLRWERDLWYFVANNKGKRPNDYYTHLTNQLWQEGAA